MKKHALLLALLLPLMPMMAQEGERPEGVVDYENFHNKTLQGYMCSPTETPYGIVATNDHGTEIYLLSNGKLETLYAAPGCGRYMQFNADRTKIGFKAINEQLEQAPAVLDLASKQVDLLESYSYQCGQVSFAENGTIVYVHNNELVVRGEETKRFPLKEYANIVNISPDGLRAALSNADGQPMLIDLTSGVQKVLSDLGDFYVNAWSPDGSKLIFEQATRNVYVYNLKNAKFIRIDQGANAVWIDDNTVAYAHSHYSNGHVEDYMGSSIRFASTDGLRIQTVVPMSMESPQDVSLMNDGRLAVSYTYQNRRLVALDVNKHKVEVLYQIPNNEEFGLHFDMRAMSSAASANHAPQQAMAGSIGAKDIPYINQRGDTPYSDYGGCKEYEGSACGPSSACMLLGYYGYLTPHAYNCGAPWGSVNYYSWYVQGRYTSHGNKHDFKEVGNGETSCNTQGGLGYLWQTSAGHRPSNCMNAFINLNDIADANFDSRGGLTAIRAECTNNNPFIWCITSAVSSGHVILPFRADVRYSESANTFYALTGTVVVHDPAADYNQAGFYMDGRYTNYDYYGYNNGYFTMYHAWGVYVHASKLNADKTAPVIKNAKIINLSSKGYIVTCEATDNVGIAKLSFPTWTVANGQDDIKWGEVYTPTSGNTYQYNVKISDHNNERGQYITHIYAYDAAGNSVCQTLSAVTIPQPDTVAPVISNVVVSNLTYAGYTLTCDIVDNNNLVDESRSSVAVWTNKKKDGTDQDDLEWVHFQHVSGNTYKVDVDVADHNYEDGLYINHIYAYDTDGNHVLLGKNVTVPPMAQIQNVQLSNVSTAGFTISCSVTDNKLPLTKVEVAVWTGTADASGNTQDDLKWVQMSNTSGNNWSASVLASDHKNEVKDYMCHIYVHSNKYVTVLKKEHFDIDGTTPATTHTISVATNPVGLESLVSGAGSYDEGTSVTLTASNNSEYTFTQWSDGNTNASRTITVSADATYTAQYTKNDSPTPVGDCNPYGWKTGEEMYQALAADVIAAKEAGMNFTFCSEFGLGLRETFGAANVDHDAYEGIGYDIQTFDMAFFTTEPYKAKWTWLENHIEERCVADGKEGPISATDSHSNIMRWNLAAFFSNSSSSAWPATANYTSYGISSTEYYSTWGSKLCTDDPTTDMEQVNASSLEVRKIVENGRLVIIYNGVRYNAQGFIIK